jgi:hypothetical protein
MVSTGFVSTGGEVFSFEQASIRLINSVAAVAKYNLFIFYSLKISTFSDKNTELVIQRSFSFDQVPFIFCKIKTISFETNDRYATTSKINYTSNDNNL